MADLGTMTASDAVTCRRAIRRRGYGEKPRFLRIPRRGFIIVRTWLYDIRMDYLSFFCGLRINNMHAYLTDNDVRA